VLPLTLPAIDLFLNHDFLFSTKKFTPRAFVRLVISHFKHVTSLSLCPSPLVSFRDTADVIASLPLTRLVLSHRASFDGPRSGRGKWNCLCGNEGEACSIKFATDLLPRLSSLRHLSITVDYTIDQTPVADLLESLPFTLKLLTHLSLLHCPKSRYKDLMEQRNASLSNFSLLKDLQELTVEFDFPLTDFIQLLFRLPKVSLHISQVGIASPQMHNISVVGCATLRECALQSEFISGAWFESCDNLTSLSIESIRGNIYVARCKSLVTLQCSMTPYDDDWSLEIHACPSLETIGCTNRAPHTLRVSNCPNVRSLRVNNDEFKFIDSGASLSSLIITQPIPSSKVIQILSQFPNLTSLEVNKEEPHMKISNAPFLKRFETEVESESFFEFDCPLLEELIMESHSSFIFTVHVTGLSQSSRFSKLQLPSRFDFGGPNGLKDLSALTFLDMKLFTGQFALPLSLTDLIISDFFIPETYTIFSHPALERLNIHQIHIHSKKGIEIQCPRLKKLRVVSPERESLNLGHTACSSLELLNLNWELDLKDAITILGNNPSLWSSGPVAVSRLLSVHCKEDVQLLLDDISTDGDMSACLPSSKREFFSDKLKTLLQSIGSCTVSPAFSSPF